jgi:two-component system sensor histidine kinase HydH
VLEIEFSMATVQTAMERGSRLGIGLMILSLLFVAMIVYAMVERELVVPLVKTERLAEQRRVLLEERAGFAEVGELAAEMAHEFKRPLASIRSAVMLLEQEYTIPGNGQMLLGGIESQLERLSDTMRDVFGLAKPIGIDAAPLDLAEVLDGALMQIAAAAQNAGVKIERDYTRAITVPGDARRLELAFTNLFNNAVDAMNTTGGTLTVRARDDDGAVMVEVRDTGIGIDASQLGDVMRPFFSTKTTGTGLGLPLVARIIRAHGGELKIESTKGMGTTVHVSFKWSDLEEETWQARAS